MRTVIGIHAFGKFSGRAIGIAQRHPAFDILGLGRDQLFQIGNGAVIVAQPLLVQRRLHLRHAVIGRGRLDAMIDRNGGVELAQGFKPVRQQNLRQPQIGAQIQRHAQIEDRDIGALAVGQGGGDAEQRLGGAVGGGADQAFGLGARRDARQAWAGDAGQSPIAGMAAIKFGGVLAAAIAFQETPIGLQRPRRCRGGPQGFLVGRLGGGGIAQIVLQQRGVEHSHALGPVLRQQGLQILLHSRLIMLGHGGPGIEQG